jgi:protein SCO1
MRSFFSHHAQQNKFVVTASLSTTAMRRGMNALIGPSTLRRHTATEASHETSRGGRRPRSKAELIGLIAGCSLFPISVAWMTRNDGKEEPNNSMTASPTSSVAPAFGKMEVTTVPKPQLGGPFTLLSSRTGKPVTDHDVFDGRWTLLYFGFSKCAEICPNTLTFITELMAASDKLYGGPDDDTKPEADKLQAVFLSIDFVRDTPSVVEEFVGKYDLPKKRITGLCGAKAEVEEAARNWRVYFSSYDESEEERAAREAKGVPVPELDDQYQFDHSSAIYLVGPDGKMKDFYFREIGVPTTVDRLGLHFRDAYGINQ